MKTVKHGGVCIIIWGCFSYLVLHNGVRPIYRLPGIRDQFADFIRQHFEQLITGQLLLDFVKDLMKFGMSIKDMYVTISPLSS